MLVLDANIWIAALNEDDSQHEKALKLFALIDEPIGMPEAILCEILNVLILKMGKSTADAFLERSLNNPDIELLWNFPKQFKAQAKFFLSNSYGDLSFIDQGLLFLAQQGHRVYSFDQALAKKLKP